MKQNILVSPSVQHKMEQVSVEMMGVSKRLREAEPIVKSVSCYFVQQFKGQDFYSSIKKVLSNSS